MGMYDHVDVYVPLPDGSSPEGRGFQSKDFGCHMDTIKITEAGRLVFEECHYENVPPVERPYPNDDGLRGLMGCIRRVYDRDVDMDYHGDVEFYDLETRYVARFTDGVLTRITATCNYCEGTGTSGERAEDGAPLVCTACQGGRR